MLCDVAGIAYPADMARDLTELEAAVLGELSQQQPCTAYSIRRTFAVSPTVTWSSSAGTIYPVLERLEARKLIRSRKIKRGQRVISMLRLTPAGTRQIKHWLVNRLDREILGPQVDLLRLRVGFLSELTRAQQVRFLEQAIEGIAVDVRRAERHLRSTSKSSKWAVHTSRAVLMIQRTRLQWIRDVLKAAK
jgi:DNA-binding PadR family transcriptional regulator